MKTVIEMARDQGLPETATEGVFLVNKDDLGRFAELVRADEREACESLRKALAEQPAQDVPEVGFGNTALDKKAENARELGLDYEPAQRTWVGLSDAQNTVIWANSQSVDGAIRATEKQLMENNI